MKKGQGFGKACVPDRSLLVPSRAFPAILFVNRAAHPVPRNLNGIVNRLMGNVEAIGSITLHVAANEILD